MSNLATTITEWAYLILSVLVLGQVYEAYAEYKKNKAVKISFSNVIPVLILLFLLLYSFIYKPYFTKMGRIIREVKQEERFEKKALYYACGLPKDNKIYLKLSSECKKLELGTKYEAGYQNCSPDYMGGCN